MPATTTGGDIGALGLEAFEKLSPREKNVLLELMSGATARQICDQDYVSLATVRSQIHAIISKLGVNSQLGAVVLAYRSGWRPAGREQEARRF